MADPKYIVVAYFTRQGDVRQVSRFSCEEKAKKAVMASQLAGQRAEMVGIGLPLPEAKAMMVTYKRENSIPSGTPAIPGKERGVRAKPTKPAKVKTRTETNEHGTFEIRSTRVKFVQNT